MQMRVTWLAVAPANSICRCVPSPGSNSTPSPSHRSRYPLWLRLRVGAWLAVPRTTSSRSDTALDPTPGSKAGIRAATSLPAAVVQSAQMSNGCSGAERLAWGIVVADDLTRETCHDNDKPLRLLRTRRGGGNQHLRGDRRP